MYSVVNVSHDIVDFCIIKQDLSSLLCTLSPRAIRLGTFCRKIVIEKARLQEDFYAGDFHMVHQF